MFTWLLGSAILLGAQEAAAKESTLNEASSGYSFTAILIVIAFVGILVRYGFNHLEFMKSLGASKKRLDKTRIDTYNHLQDDSKTEVIGREEHYKNLVNTYYDLATEFYEWGWGTSFHFANQIRGENFHSSILRHEHFIAGRLNVKHGAKVLDCGCGIGGPARNIARFTGADITAITINQFQVDRGNDLCKKQGIADQVKLVQGDFMKLPFADNSFDAVYAIEATCHAPDRNGVYSEILRVLKPGGVFATYEWCLTDKYDKTNEVHRKIKKDIEVGDGLPDMVHTSVCTKALEDVGFEVLEARDEALVSMHGRRPWYFPLLTSWSPFHQPGFQFNPFMRKALPAVLGVFEKIGLVPAGTGETQVMLQAGGLGCQQGGVTGVFTPMWLMVAQKPNYKLDQTQHAPMAPDAPAARSVSCKV
jgi:sterol 24-C-methyltransferase